MSSCLGHHGLRCNSDYSLPMYHAFSCLRPCLGTVGPDMRPCLGPVGSGVSLCKNKIGID